MPEPWLTKAEVARKLRVSTRTVTRLGLPHRSVGRQNRYVWSEVEACINGVPPEGGNVIRFPRRAERAA